MVLIQNYSLQDLFAKSQREIEQLAASEGEVVGQINKPGVYYNEDMNKIVAVVKHDLLKELKTNTNKDDVDIDVALSDKKIGIRQLKEKEEEITQGIADVLGFTYKKTHKILSRIYDINKKTFRGKEFLLPTLSETSAIIDIITKFPKSYYILYWEGLSKTKRIFKKYYPIKELELSYSYPDINRALKEVGWRPIANTKVVLKKDVDTLVGILKHDFSRD